MRNRIEQETRKREGRQRTREEMTLDVLEALKTEGEMKKTPLGERCTLNYITISDMTEQLTKDELIKRDSHGFFSITELGISFLKGKELTPGQLNEVISIAREIANISEEDIIDQESDRCRLCGRRDYDEDEHEDDCIWKRLNEIFNMEGQ
jgi:predicted transcriptional regulator